MRESESECCNQQHAHRSGRDGKAQVSPLAPEAKSPIVVPSVPDKNDGEPIVDFAWHFDFALGVKSHSQNRCQKQ